VRYAIVRVPSWPVETRPDPTPEPCAVVRHCRHSVPIGPCRYCLDEGYVENSQPVTIATLDGLKVAEWVAANRRAQAGRFDLLTYSVVTL
jgi:hypothetical protein